MVQTIEADKHLHIMAPPQLVTAIDKAAARTFSSRSEYIRRAMMLALKTDGLMEKPFTELDRRP